MTGTVAGAPAKFELTGKDGRVLEVVHPTLEKIVRRAAKITEMPFMVFEGVRTLRRQKTLKKQGASRTLNSRHLSGHAVDLVPIINGKPVWDVPATMVIAAAMFQAAEELGYIGKMRWGGDWDEDGDYYDSKFYDGPHFELKSQFYPADRPAVRTTRYLESRTTDAPPSQLRTTVSKYSGTHKTAFAASVQTALVDMGVKVDSKPITVDGYYGDDTRAYVARAQEVLAIEPADGLWGPATSKAYHKWRAARTARQREAHADAQQVARRAEDQAAAHGVVSDDKSTRPVSSKSAVVDREAAREKSRDATPDEPVYKQGTEQGSAGGAGVPTWVLLLVMALIAGVLVFGSLTS